jgi:hypothetical protein
MNEYNDAPEERARVFGRIAPIVMAFYRERVGRLFSAEQLRRYVLEREPTTAPDSPGRILRELRLRGRLDYAVINRRKSLYQFRFRKPLEGVHVSQVRPA